MKDETDTQVEGPTLLPHTVTTKVGAELRIGNGGEFQVKGMPATAGERAAMRKRRNAVP